MPSIIKSIIAFVFPVKKENKDNNNNNDNNNHLYDYSRFGDEQIMQISYRIQKSLENAELSNPTFDDIDDMLIAFNYFLQFDHAVYNNLIQLAPEKFMLAYANNAERIPHIIAYLTKCNPEPVQIIMNYMSDVARQTFQQRYN